MMTARNRLTAVDVHVAAADCDEAVHRAAVVAEPATERRAGVDASLPRRSVLRIARSTSDEAVGRAMRRISGSVSAQPNSLIPTARTVTSSSGRTS